MKVDDLPLQMSVLCEVRVTKTVFSDPSLIGMVHHSQVGKYNSWKKLNYLFVECQSPAQL